MRIKLSLMAILGLLGVVCIVSLARRPMTKTHVQSVLKRAWNSIDSGDLASASQEAERLLKSIPNLDEAEFVLATVALFQHDVNRASELATRVSDRFFADHPDRVLAYSSLAVKQGAPSQCESTLRRLIRINPSALEPRFALLKILRTTGRNREALPLIEMAIAQSRYTLSDLLSAAAPRGYWASTTEQQVLLNERNKSMSAPLKDPLIGLAEARYEAVSGRAEHAEPILREIVRRWPEQLDSLVLLGSVLAELEKDEEYQKWESNLPAEALAARGENRDCG